ncbi:MAG TPA: periplasmic heavy metal sensor [Burkholderiales bacterium]|nr:periplasmic heavy metal sensor [Burkholderiales bacterium]
MKHAQKAIVRRWLFTSALALGVAGSVTAFQSAAYAEGRPGPAAHRWHRSHARLDKLMNELKLNAEQQQAWHAIEARRDAMRRELYHGRAELRRALTAELAKPEPDLARLAALRDRARDHAMQGRKEIEDLQLKLYASLSPQQKTTVRDFLKARLARMEQWRRHERDRRGGHRGDQPAARDRS